MHYIDTKFDAQLIRRGNINVEAEIRSVTPDEIRKMNVTSLIRDEDTARVVSHSLGFEVPVNPMNIEIGPGDSIVIPQFIAGLKPDGTVSLPYVGIESFLVISLYPF